MDDFKYLLVSEGPTDIAFIKKLSNQLGSELGGNVIIQEMSPQKDATTDTYPRHGWTGVRKWCLANKNKTTHDLNKVNPAFRELLKRKNWLALVKASNAKGIIIQMDTDIAEKISDLTPNFSGSGLGRRDFCNSAILFWLGLNDDSVDKPYILLPVVFKSLCHPYS